MPRGNFRHIVRHAPGKLPGRAGFCQVVPGDWWYKGIVLRLTDGAMGLCLWPLCAWGCMVTLFDIARIAARHTTRMAVAMRRALLERGVDADALAYAERRYDGVVECMRNVVSPLDLRAARRHG